MKNNNFKTKWNWGAFINPISFGVGNRAYLCLLTLVPFLNIAWIFIAGAKAESWALANSKNEYRDEEEFRKIMDTWKRGGLVQFIAVSVILVMETLVFLITFGVVMASFNSFEHDRNNQVYHTHYRSYYDDDDADDSADDDDSAVSVEIKSDDTSIFFTTMEERF